MKATPGELQEGCRYRVPTWRACWASCRSTRTSCCPRRATFPFLNDTQDQANDNRIINVALKLQSQQPDAFVCLVTKDINMRLKAKGSGLEHVEDYRRDVVLDDIDLLAKGYEQIEGDFWAGISEVDTLREGDRTLHRVPREALPKAYPNMFLFDDNDFFAYVKRVDDEFVYLRCDSRDNLMHRKFWGLSPRNLEQAMAMELIDDDSVDMTVLTGPAGSGKTLIALAYGLHAILEQKKYNKLIVARSTPPIAEDIGFLPGTEEEKMAPWLAAFDDNLEILHGADECSHGSIDYVKERANIQFKSLNFMRGRSFNNAYIIIDESQGLTQFQLKSVITRVGAGSRIVVLGNLAQIDNKYISPLTSASPTWSRSARTSITPASCTSTASSVLAWQPSLKRNLCNLDRAPLRGARLQLASFQTRREPVPGGSTAPSMAPTV